MLTDPKLCAQVDVLWDKFWMGGLPSPLSAICQFAGVMARVESLRGRMGESTRQVEGLFESLLAQSFDGGR
ncbi:MAG: hypothetical protein HY869_05480 [Chloroflexi bacterium]|nr:hypothetical protein [Chloroflexota bacterium]